MTTFSQLVDQMILETKRPDLAAEIALYANQTLREMHTEPAEKKAICFGENRKEDQLVASHATDYRWVIPDHARFQAIETFRYDNVSDEGEMVYPPIMQPGRALRGKLWYAYRSGNEFVFEGYGGLGAIISVSWFEFVRRHKYYLPAARTATWDDESGWTYAPGTDTAEEQATARDLMSNWILIRWPDTVREGLRAKIYKRVDNEVRAKTSYSLYTQMHNEFVTAEAGMLQGFSSNL